MQSKKRPSTPVSGEPSSSGRAGVDAGSKRPRLTEDEVGGDDVLLPLAGLHIAHRVEESLCLRVHPLMCPPCSLPHTQRREEKERALGEVVEELKGEVPASVLASVRVKRRSSDGKYVFAFGGDTCVHRPKLKGLLWDAAAAGQAGSIEEELSDHEVRSIPGVGCRRVRVTNCQTSPRHLPLPQDVGTQAAASQQELQAKLVAAAKAKEPASSAAGEPSATSPHRPAPKQHPQPPRCTPRQQLLQQQQVQVQVQQQHQRQAAQPPPLPPQ